MLYIDPLFKYHWKQLRSNGIRDLLKACHYFSYTRLINYQIITRLKSLIEHKNRLVSYAAVSALMASKVVDDRAYGLSRAVRRAKISNMAIIELIYEFKNSELDQSEEEIKYLKEIIFDQQVPVDIKAVIILAVEELGYYQLQGFLFSFISNKDEYWSNPEIKRAIMLALGKFGYTEATPYIRQCTLSTNIDVFEAGVEALASFGGEENFDFIISLISENNLKNELIFKSLLKNGYSQVDIEKSLEIDNQANQDFSLIMDIINQKPLST